MRNVCFQCDSQTVILHRVNKASDCRLRTFLRQMFIHYIAAAKSTSINNYYHIVAQQHMQSANVVILMQIPKIHSITSLIL